MEPIKPLDFGEAWWPKALGQPSTSGAQNDLRYAFFPDARRLVVEDRGALTTYDTADHRIGGVSQQQGHGGSLAFTSQHGPVALEELAVVEGHGAAPRSSSSAHAATSTVADTPPARTTPPRRPDPSAASHPRSAEERVVFSEGGDDGASVKVVAQGQLDEDLLEALEDFVRRQRKRRAKAR